VREIRTLRVMWRGLETASRAITERPRQFPTLPETVTPCVKVFSTTFSVWTLTGVADCISVKLQDSIAKGGGFTVFCISYERMDGEDDKRSVADWDADIKTIECGIVLHSPLGC